MNRTPTRVFSYIIHELNNDSGMFVHTRVFSYIIHELHTNADRIYRNQTNKDRIYRIQGDKIDRH